MKIAVNCRLLVPEKMDGIGRFTYETLLQISQKQSKHQFTFIFDRKIDASIFSFPSNAKIISIFPPARHPILWITWFEVKLKNYLNRNSFDLFLSPEGWIPGGLKCKSLGVIHDLNFEHHPENIIYSHRKYLKYFFPKYAKRADRIATVSEYSKKDIVNTYGINESTIDVVYNGANSVFRPISEKAKEKIKVQYSQGFEYFLFVGTLHPRKNLEHLFKAFNVFKSKRQSDIKLLVVGNRKWWPIELQTVFESLEHKNDVLFIGRLTDIDLSNVMASCLALTYLPYFEGFGIPILEAFNCEVPVITSNVTSMPEVAKNAAILCAPKDVNQIANAMGLLSENKLKREELITKGLERCKDFSWSRTADLLWESILKTIS